MKYPCVRQIDMTDCAAACLSTICKYYKKNISISTIRKYASTDKNGTNGIGLIKASKKLGYNCEGYAVDDKKLENNEVKTPFIAHVIMNGCNHYVVVFEYSDKDITLADPAEGIKKYSLEEFKSYWTGVLFVLDKNEDFEKIKSEKTTLRKMVSLIYQERSYVAKIFFISILYTILGIIGAMYFNVLFDDIVPGENITKLKYATIVFIVISLFQMIFHYIRVRVVIKLERNIDKEITLKTFRHILHLPLDFFAMRQTGEIISRLNDSYKIRDALSGASVSVLIDSIMAIICGVFLFYLDNRLFFITLIVVVLYYLFNKLFKTNIKRKQREVMESNADVNSDYIEMIKGIETIKSYGAESFIDNEASDVFSKFLSNISKLEKSHNNMGFFLNSVESIGYVVILSVGSLMVINGELSVGSLLAFYSLLGHFITPLSSLINLQIRLQGAMIAFERIDDIKENETECLNEDKKTFDNINSIEIKNLRFKYGERKPVLKNISMNIPINNKIAIVGESGCGKTTLAKLLMGFYDYESGDILINGCSVNAINKVWLRKKIVYVSQEPYFFNGSIRDNILFGLDKSEIKDDIIMDYARKLHIDEFILSSPDGLASELQEGATNISGGQKQRLALLRAFLHDPEVIIMDEATSHLDTITEKAITETIEKMDSKITIIIIAHRLSTIKSCDCIFVLNDGELKEKGSHNELISQKGYYNSLWKNVS